MNKKLYINLPVKDLAKSKEFFEKVGFTFNKDFESEQNAAIAINDDATILLSTEDFFKQVLKKELADASKVLETIIAVSATNQEEVDKMVEAALANGGGDPADPIDDDFMYDRGFYDLDGHLWRINCLK